MSAEFAEHQPEPREWRFVPSHPEDLQAARRTLMTSSDFTEVKEAMTLAVSELAGNFFKHEDGLPGALRAIRHADHIRLEVFVPPLPATEREFQKMFWAADEARARFLVDRKYGNQQVFAEEYTPQLSEGGRGSLIVHVDADRRGFVPYIDADGQSVEDDDISPNQYSKIWLEYDFMPSTGSHPEL